MLASATQCDTARAPCFDEAASLTAQLLLRTAGQSALRKAMS